MSSDSTSAEVPVPGVGVSRRRARAEAPRSAVVRVRLSPEEAAVVGAAAAGAGVSVGAWVGETAVRRARVQARGEVEEPGPSSWQELVAALVALRTEVVGGHRVPVEELGSAVAAGEVLDGHPDSRDDSGVAGMLRRIDAATAAASDAASAAHRAAARRSGRRGSGGSS